MKTAKRIQLLLSPVLIAMLALMLAVVSFGWYKATFDGEIKTESTSTNITVEAPAYIDVQLSEEPIADKYKYQEVEVEGNKIGQYVITNENGDLEGYFGQTGEYDVNSENDDKPYIAFYSVTITTHIKYIDVNSAYVNGLEITKQNKTKESYLDWEKEDSKFKVYFYTYDESTKTFSNESETFVVGDKATEVNTYIGIHFDDPESSKAFAYSDIEYYGSTYQIHLKFYLETE